MCDLCDGRPLGERRNRDFAEIIKVKRDFYLVYTNPVRKYTYALRKIKYCPECGRRL